LAAVVETEDCRLLCQIQDAGRGRHERDRNPNAYGASADPDDLSWTVPHVLSIDDIERLIDDFAESSRRLQSCGFSGVELSACHGHLFHQFLSPWMNTRTDEFGGGIEGRLRLMLRLIAAIRGQCGSRFLIGVKMPGDDGLRGSIDPVHAAELAQRLAASGRVDYFCFAQGAHARTLDLHEPDLHGPRAPYVGLTRRLRAAVRGVPVMALGLITDPAEADAIVAQGSAELIGLGRPLVTDPGGALKASQGREAAMRYCVSCNTCWAAIVEHQAVACDNNPRVGRADEFDYWPAKIRMRRRIVIVGAGVAGMEAGWLAAARGHDATINASPRGAQGCSCNSVCMRRRRRCSAWRRMRSSSPPGHRCPGRENFRRSGGRPAYCRIYGRACRTWRTSRRLKVEPRSSTTRMPRRALMPELSAFAHFSTES
jgi:2,4-dienoyl-CoA reductase-like NADH-dependent reductase (Old Yellow Enzyme family)